MWLVRTLVSLVILTLAMVSFAGQAADLYLQDGSMITGEWTGLHGDQFVISTKYGALRVPVSDIYYLQLDPEFRLDEPHTDLGIVLRDGTIVRGDVELYSTGNPVRVAVPEGTLRYDVSRIAAIVIEMPPTVAGDPLAAIIGDLESLAESATEALDEDLRADLQQVISRLRGLEMPTVTVAEGARPAVQTFTEDGFSFALNDARISDDTITVQVLITSLDDNQALRVFVGGAYRMQTHLVDNLGVRYNPSMMTLGQDSTRSYMNYTFTREIPTLLSFTFTNVPSEIEELALFSLEASKGRDADLKIEFRHVQLTR